MRVLHEELAAFSEDQRSLVTTIEVAKPSPRCRVGGDDHEVHTPENRATISGFIEASSGVRSNWSRARSSPRRRRSSMAPVASDYAHA